MTRIHLALSTADLSASTAFYRTLLDAAPDKVHDDHVRFQPADIPLTLTLMPGEPAPGPNHLGLKLPAAADTKAAWQRLVAAGLEVRTEQDVTCCWAVQNKAWVVDPDGRPWEVYTVTDDAPAEETAPPVSACCA